LNPLPGVCARGAVRDQRHVLCKQGTFKVHHVDRRRGFTGKELEDLFPRPDMSGRSELHKVVPQQFRNTGAIAAHRWVEQGFWSATCSGQVIFLLRLWL
jgi:hypothetical protein